MSPAALLVLVAGTVQAAPATCTIRPGAGRFTYSMEHCLHGTFDLKLTDFDLKLPSLLGVEMKDQRRPCSSAAAGER